MMESFTFQIFGDEEHSAAVEGAARSKQVKNLENKKIQKSGGLRIGSLTYKKKVGGKVRKMIDT